MSLPESLIKMLPGICGDHIKINDPISLETKIQKIKEGGLDKLQIITDYDMTMTKHHVDGVLTNSSFGLFTLTSHLPEGFMKENRELKAKYFPIEVDPKLSPAEKVPHMVEWYAESERMFIGISWTSDDLAETAKKTLPELRDGTQELLKFLKEKQVPVLVLSAGLGDVIKAVLTCHEIEESNLLHIVSNFFRTDKDGVINGMGCHENGQFIHPFNKNGLGCKDYFENLGSRNNIILMGDSIGDADMNNGVPNVENVLKIGFLYGSESFIAASLPNYIKHFDIVLVDDQTMKIPTDIINVISN